jgi:hypothetical protein
MLESRALTTGKWLWIDYDYELTTTMNWLQLRIDYDYELTSNFPNGDLPHGSCYFNCDGGYLPLWVTTLVTTSDRIGQSVDLAYLSISPIH